MEPEKIIIHVGLHKTATTFLQNVVFPRLDTVAYFGRPYTQENYAFNTLQFADSSLYKESEARAEFDRLFNAAKGKPILLSDELFSGFVHYNYINRGFIAERLSKLVPQAEIVLFLRGQTELILSLYNQYVKHGWFENRLDDTFLHRPGKGMTLEDWVSRTGNWKDRDRYINSRSWFSPEHFRYSKLYALYSGLFKKVHIFLFEEFKNDPNACLLRLASILSADMSPDWELDKLSRQKPVNQSLTQNQLEVRRFQNKMAHLFPFTRKWYGVWFARAIARLRPSLEPGNTTHVVSSLKESGIFRDNYELNKKFSLGMEKFPDLYFGDEFSS